MAIRYRRNVACLGTDALHDLREALATMFALPASDEHSFAALAGLHGTPGNFCRHGAPGFLTWHRAYMHVFERALRCVNSSITLPFWDWSSGPTTGVPAVIASTMTLAPPSITEGWTRTCASRRAHRPMWCAPQAPPGRPRSARAPA